MTSASEAVKRLKGESLQQKSLTQLKKDAADLELTKEDVREFGNLSHKQTWVDAINDFMGKLFDEPAPKVSDMVALFEEPEAAFDPVVTVTETSVCEVQQEEILSDVHPIQTEIFTIPLGFVNDYFSNHVGEPVPPLEEIQTNYPLSVPNPVAAFVNDYFATHVGEPVPTSFLALLTQQNNSDHPEYSELACLIGHPALFEDELCDPAGTSEYWGSDDRGLPTHQIVYFEDKTVKYSLIDGSEEILATTEPDALSPNWFNRLLAALEQPRFIPKIIHYPRHEIYRIFDTLNGVWVKDTPQDEQGYKALEDAEKRIQQLTQLSGMLAV